MSLKYIQIDAVFPLSTLNSSNQYVGFSLLCIANLVPKKIVINLFRIQNFQLHGLLTNKEPITIWIRRGPLSIYFTLLITKLPEIGRKWVRKGCDISSSCVLYIFCLSDLECCGPTRVLCEYNARPLCFHRLIFCLVFF